ncbi:uncharacterized protein F4812DRAFT_420990 [Daldinia caldariorum]|uniref:uncharacterized protein n=1 Tax=Daldinia caldariorum TaxID=326644 RepID=UPI0020082CAA|nr:uncharacterized protein F4812DRAFT_420990 [Daldinia caldariorum]KAI1469947.1 hypothetical protein F4812DRAFT_420990 [Daldinia caldariorum]
MARYSYSSRRSTPAPSYRSKSPPPAYSERTPLVRTEYKIRQAHINIPRPPDTVILEYFLLFLSFALVVCVIGLPIFFLLHRGPVVPPLPPPPPPVHSIAIVGAGPAGICAAQHLYHQAEARDIHVNITIFESAPLIGGQLALNSSTGGPVFPYDDPAQNPIIAEDIAGTALLWGNPLFTKTSEKILGDKVQISEAGSQRVSYFTGDKVVAQTTRPYSKTPFFDWMGLIFRYGTSVWSAGAMAKQGAELQDRFANALPLDVPGVAHLMTAAGVFDYVRKSSPQELADRGIAGDYVSDILDPEVSRVYHARSMPEVSALTLMLAAGVEDTAAAYQGGELLERLEMVLAAVSARVRVRESTEVHGIKHAQISENETAWLVQFSTNPDTSIPRQAAPFDKVIIAAPWFDSDADAASALAYRAAHVVFFTVPRRIDAYGGGDVNQVLFLENALGGVRELAFVREVARIADDGRSTTEYLYRALADDDARQRLEQLGLGITWLYQKKLENAYPYMFPASRFPPFKLSDEGLWWTSPMHMVASTVDTSCHAGKIVAEQLVSELKR